MTEEFDKVLKSGGAGSTGPVILKKGEWVRSRIRGILKAWNRHWPQEVQAHGLACQSLRQNAQWKGKYTQTVYTKENRNTCFEVKVHKRIDMAMRRLFGSEWWDDPEVYPEFVKHYQIGWISIPGRPGPNSARIRSPHDAAGNPINPGSTQYKNF